MSERDAETVQAMATYGGSFVKALAECFGRADAENFIKLKTTFGDYWLEYEMMAARRRRKV